MWSWYALLQGLFASVFAPGALQSVGRIFEDQSAPELPGATRRRLRDAQEDRGAALDISRATDSAAPLALAHTARVQRMVDLEELAFQAVVELAMARELGTVRSGPETHPLRGGVPCTVRALCEKLAVLHHREFGKFRRLKGRH